MHNYSYLHDMPSHVQGCCDDLLHQAHLWESSWLIHRSFLLQGELIIRISKWVPYLTLQNRIDRTSAGLYRPSSSVNAKWQVSNAQEKECRRSTRQLLHYPVLTTIQVGKVLQLHTCHAVCSHRSLSLFSPVWVLSETNLWASICLCMYLCKAWMHVCLDSNKLSVWESMIFRVEVTSQCPKVQSRYHHWTSHITCPEHFNCGKDPITNSH